MLRKKLLIALVAVTTTLVAPIGQARNGHDNNRVDDTIGICHLKPDNTYKLLNLKADAALYYLENYDYYGEADRLANDNGDCIFE